MFEGEAEAFLGKFGRSLAMTGISGAMVAVVASGKLLRLRVLMRPD